MNEEDREMLRETAADLVQYILLDKAGLAGDILRPDDPTDECLPGYGWTNQQRDEAVKYIEGIAETAVKAINNMASERKGSD